MLRTSIPTAKWHQEAHDVHPDSTAARGQPPGRENMSGGLMIDIHFYCPVVWRRIDTGIQMDQTTFERTRLNIVHVPCPHCDRTHRLLIGDSQIDTRGDNDWRELLGRDVATGLLSAAAALKTRGRWLDAVARNRQRHSLAR